MVLVVHAIICTASATVQLCANLSSLPETPQKYFRTHVKAALVSYLGYDFCRK